MERIKLQTQTETGRIRLFVDDEEVTNEVPEGFMKAVKIEMWYDRHFKHWVIYPVDIFGNQTEEARYGFGKKEANEIRKELEAEIA